MAVTTPLRKVPPEVMRALLQVYGPVAASCPYRFLLTDAQCALAAGEPEASDPMALLAPHMAWLRDADFVAPGESALSPTWAATMALLVRPKHRIHIIDATPEKVRRVLFVSDAQQLAFAMFDRTHCLISAPFAYEQALERLLEAIGHPQDSETPPTPLRTDHRVLRVMGVLTEAGIQRKPNLSAAQKPDNSGMTEDRAERLLEQLLEDPMLSQAVLVDLLADRILIAEGGRIWLHPNFVPWHEALQSASQLELLRVLCGDTMEDPASEPQRRLFLGPRRQRCIVWPSEEGEDELIVGRPHREDLRALLGEFLGAPNDNTPADEPEEGDHKAWTKGKFAFRG